MKIDFREQNLKEWENLLDDLFKGTIPNNYLWTNIFDIIDVLNFIGRTPPINHTFFPTGGGLDLSGAEESVEKNCIEIYFNTSAAYIVKPDVLTFQSFGVSHEWSYFRLDTKQLKPSGVYENLTGQHEELTEIRPGVYVDRIYWDGGYYGQDEYGQELSLPESSRVITRFFSGSFVIFAKGSTYNANSSTYDARHSKVTAGEFRNYIARTIDRLSEDGFI